MAYLKLFDVDTLKIDKYFITRLPEDQESLSIYCAIASLAKALRLELVAEGVETFRCLEYLKNSGCEKIQGYYFSKPLSPIDFAKLSSEFLQAQSVTHSV